jgi:hypothetical protein
MQGGVIAANLYRVSPVTKKILKYLFFTLTLSLPGKFYLDMLETPGTFLVICSASFKKITKN